MDTIDHGLHILFQDGALLAVNKPSGLPVHRGWARSSNNLNRLVSAARGEQAHLLHRLDQGTSGVVLFALTPEVAAAMRAQFDAHRVDKRYLALVRGESPAIGLVDYAIPRAPGEQRVAAQTAFRTLASVATAPRAMSLVEAAPRTGRLHQVRRHLKHLRHPVVNDANHGDNRFNRAVQAAHGLTRLALHALAVRIEHPLTGESLDLAAPLPADLAEPLQRMGFDAALWTTPATCLDDAWPSAVLPVVQGPDQRSAGR